MVLNNAVLEKAVSGSKLYSTVSTLQYTIRWKYKSRALLSCLSLSLYSIDVLRYVSVQVM